MPGWVGAALTKPGRASTARWCGPHRRRTAAYTKVRLSLGNNGDGTTQGFFRLTDLQATILKNAVEAIIAPRKIGADRIDPATGKRLDYPTLLGQGFCELIEHLPVDGLPRHGRVPVTLLVGLDHQVLASALGGLDAGCCPTCSTSRRPTNHRPPQDRPRISTCRGPASSSAASTTDSPTTTTTSTNDYPTATSDSPDAAETPSNPYRRPRRLATKDHPGLSNVPWRPTPRLNRVAPSRPSAVTDCTPNSNS